MELNTLVKLIADTLKEFDSTKPRQAGKNFKAGIGPYGEPQLIKKLSELLKQKGYPCQTARTPDLMFGVFVEGNDHAPSTYSVKCGRSPSQIVYFHMAELRQTHPF
jgi:hypothetical protein